MTVLSQLFVPTDRNNRSGQALVEILISSAVLILVIFGIVSAVNFALNTATAAKNKTLSLYYAQQQLELARGARNISWVSLVNTVETASTISNTPFTSTIVVRNEDNTGDCFSIDDTCRVIATITWQNGPKAEKTELTTLLTNWR